MGADRLEKYGITLPATRKRLKAGDHVLVMGQKADDRQHGLTAHDVSKWAEAILHQLDRPAIWRPHPKEVYPLNGLGYKFQDPKKVSIDEALESAYCAITYNSSAAFHALRAGVAVWYDPRSKFCNYRECCNALPWNGRGDWSRESVLQTLSNVSYTNWTPEEARTGAPIEHYLRWINGADS
jgi:hypothetical protein